MDIQMYSNEINDPFRKSIMFWDDRLILGTCRYSQTNSLNTIPANSFTTSFGTVGHSRTSESRTAAIHGCFRYNDHTWKHRNHDSHTEIWQTYFLAAWLVEITRMATMRIRVDFILDWVYVLSKKTLRFRTFAKIVLLLCKRKLRKFHKFFDVTRQSRYGISIEAIIFFLILYQNMSCQSISYFLRSNIDRSIYFIQF